jgi:hypothetical protein
MEEFQHDLEDAQLHDLGSKGSRFTWNNGRLGRDYTLERLDKAVANVEWCDMWRRTDVEVLACCSSDHLPLLLSLNKNGTPKRNNWSPFRYEAGWSKNGEVKKIITQEWVVRAPIRNPWMGFKGKLQRCKKAIKQWVQKNRPMSEKYIQEKSSTLVKLQEASDPHNLQMEKKKA